MPRTEGSLAEASTQGWLHGEQLGGWGSQDVAGRMQQDGRTGMLVVGVERSRGYLGRRFDRAWCWLVCGER